MRLQEATGFSKVLAEMRLARKPVCGHNMLFDLVFVLNIFGGDYPTWKEFKSACEAFFPAGIYDTKHVFKGVEKRTGRLLPTNHLGDVYVALKAPEVSKEEDAEKQALVREVLQKARDAAGDPNACVAFTTKESSLQQCAHAVHLKCLCSCHIRYGDTQFRA